jgi:hypothetical protein
MPQQVLSTLATNEPNTWARAREQELLQMIADGAWGEPLEILHRYGSDLAGGYAPLDRLVDALLSSSIAGDGQRGEIQTYARRLFYVFGLESDPDAADPVLDRDEEQRISAHAREQLVGFLQRTDEADDAYQAIIEDIRRQVLSALWREAAERTMKLPREWFVERWIRAEGVELFLDIAYGDDPKQWPQPVVGDIEYAYQGLTTLLEADQVERAKEHVGRRSVVPRLFTRLWPAAGDALLAEVSADESLASRGNLRTIIEQVEKLKQAEAPTRAA